MLTLALHLQSNRNAILKLNAKFITLIEKGIVTTMEKTKTIGRTTTHCLFIKSRLQVTGSWSSPCPLAPAYTHAFAEWLNRETYLTDAQLAALVATNSTPTAATPTYDWTTINPVFTAADRDRYTDSPESIEEVDRALALAFSATMDHATGDSWETKCHAWQWSAAAHRSTGSCCQV